jgi:hypothetical protein
MTFTIAVAGPADTRVGRVNQIKESVAISRITAIKIALPMTRGLKIQRKSVDNLISINILLQHPRIRQFP